MTQLPLSLPIGELKARYDIVVVGSGYGGGVVACRTARGGPVLLSVCVLERGREWLAGRFPSTPLAAFSELQYESAGRRFGSGTSLFDLRVDDEMMVLVGSGLGGTSLINANVMIQPKAYVFERGWPNITGGWQAELDYYSDRAARALSTARPQEMFVRKRESLFAAGKPGSQRVPELAVTLTSGPNAFGVSQRRCEMCGDCVTGCNHGAKNTVDMTYLAGARDAGAEIFCCIEVESVEKSEDEDYPWLVHARILDNAWAWFGSPVLAIRARKVFLSAGALGSTEILLRSGKHRGLALSNQLGRRFSGNGDVIAFSYNGAEKIESFGYGVKVPDAPTVGPCITGMLDERGHPEASDLPLTIQDAAVPGALALIIRLIGPWIARRTPQSWAGPGFGGVRSEMDTLSRGLQHGAAAKTQVFLAMGRDDASGEVRLSKRGRVRIHWPNGAGEELFRRINHRLAQLARRLSGRFAANPFWIRRSRKKLISVHPLGGAVMADDATAGVVNHLGQVFDGRPQASVHNGLYVCDGSIVPTSLGANPALTIAALAERIVDKLLPSLEGCDASPADPPRAPETRVDPAQPGIQYAERLTGHVTRDGKKTTLELVLHISADDVGQLLADRRHAARIIGTARMSGSCRDATDWTITDGTLNVLVDDPRSPDTRLMVYRLALQGRRGDVLYLRGHKTINLERCRLGTWKAVSSFPFILHLDRQLHDCGPKPQSVMIPGDREPSFAAACDITDAGSTGNRTLAQGDRTAIVGSGRVFNTCADALRLAASVEVTKEPSLLRRWRLAAAFGWFFGSEVIRARVWFLRRTIRQDPFCRPRPDVPLAQGKSFPDPANPENPRFKVTRYDAAREGRGLGAHVILGPGFGMSTDAFRSGQPSLLEYLRNEGFVVWLLDYRASDTLEASLAQFTLDDLVTDFKDAIGFVRKHARGCDVHVIAHCVASLVMTMLLLKHGRELKGQLKSVVLSQSFAFMDHPLVNRIKAWTRLPEVMKQFRFDPILTVDDDLRSAWKARLFGRLLQFYPTREHCSSGVCRRTIFLYGEVVRHQNLDRHTHDMMYDFFDRANLTSFVHIARMIRAGHIVDRHGREEYLTPQNGSGLSTPITLFQGLENRLFRPNGGRRTFEWLLKFGGPDPVRAKQLFGYCELPGYAHLDLFIGKQAARDVFPDFVTALLTPEKAGRRSQ